jgi:hypothetical protein
MLWQSALGGPASFLSYVACRAACTAMQLVQAALGADASHNPPCLGVVEGKNLQLLVMLLMIIVQHGLPDPALCQGVVELLVVAGAPAGGRTALV